MRLLAQGKSSTRDAVQTAGVVERSSGENTVEIYFRFEGIDPDWVVSSADPFAAALLVPSMDHGSRVSVVDPVSARLCTQLPRIRDLFRSWYPDFPCVAIETTAASPGTSASRAMTCFSGGVDSFYTLLKARTSSNILPVPLTHLLFMSGVERRQDQLGDPAETRSWLGEVARAVNATCIFGESNLRMAFEVPSKRLRYEDHYFGSVLAAHALALSGGFGYVCIPSSYSYSHIVPAGSSPVLDEMFSTENLMILHDGSEVSRAVKVAKIVEWDKELVLSHLRVCMQNRGEAYNCGQCVKCVRTAVALQICDCWDEAVTFRSKDGGRWEDALFKDHLALVEENLRLARERDARRSLVALLERVVRIRKRNAGFRQFMQNARMGSLLTALERVRHPMRSVRAQG